MKAWNIALLVTITAIFGCKTADSGGEQATLKSDDGGERAAQLYRFDPWMDALRHSVEADPNATPDAVAAAIVDGPTRVASYNLQALCRLYADQDDTFTKMRDDFKGMEDAIGNYDKWNNVLTKAKASHASASVVAKLDEKKAAAVEDIKTFLHDGKWFRADDGESRLAKIQRHLDEYQWPRYKKDREAMLNKLVDELKKIKKTDYQFKHLEAGNGLHELRRDLKWIAIEMRVLNGLVVFDKHPEQCPMPAYADLVNKPIASSKYSQLPPSTTESNVCKIPQCLYLGIVDLIESIGALKDTAEAAINTNDSDEEGDDVPPEIRKGVEKIYKSMVDNGLIGAVQDEIKKCLD